MSETVSVRRGVDLDADAITALTREAYAKWVALIGREPLPMTVDYAEAVKWHRFDLLFAGTDLAALIETVPEDGWLLIVNVAVLPASQRCGLRRQIVAIGGDLGGGNRPSRHAALHQPALYEATSPFYASLGYRVEARRGAQRGRRRAHAGQAASLRLASRPRQLRRPARVAPPSAFRQPLPRGALGFGRHRPGPSRGSVPCGRSWLPASSSHGGQIEQHVR